MPRMTHALPSPNHPSPEAAAEPCSERLPGRPYKLDEATLAEIGAKYRAGAIAPDLAEQYGVSAGTIHRHMRRLGLTKHGAGSQAARARAAAMVEHQAQEMARHRTPADLSALTAAQCYDPAVLAQIAITASGNAMLSMQIPLARQLIELSMLYTKVSHDEPISTSEAIIDIAFNRARSDHVYARRHMTGDEIQDWTIRHYWTLREPDLAAEKARAAADAARDARIKALEGEVRDMRVLFNVPEEVAALCLRVPEEEGEEEVLREIVSEATPPL